MAKRAFTIVFAIAIVFGVTMTPAAHAQFGRSNSITLEPGDWEKMKATIRAVLEEYRVGTRQAWKSDTTDRAGEAFLTEIFEKNGLRCGQITHRFTAGVGGRTYTAPLCQVADGSWKLAF